jgi:uncharacterized membrane protein
VKEVALTKGRRTTLWILSSLALLWTVIALVGVFTMGCCGLMGGGHMMGGMQGGMMGRGRMPGMMLEMTLTWLVMLGLVGVFVYLIVTARRVA